MVEEGATGVSGVDGGIGLEHVALAVGEGAVASGDAAGGDGFAKAVGIANSDRELADFDFVRVGEFEGFEFFVGLSFDAEDGDVEEAVGVDEDGGEVATVVEGDADFLVSVDDVVVGDDVSFFGDDDAGAEAGGDLAALVDALAPGVEDAFFAEDFGIDADDGGGDLFDEGDHFVIGADEAGDLGGGEGGLGGEGGVLGRILLGVVLFPKAEDGVSALPRFEDVDADEGDGKDEAEHKKSLYGIGHE